MFNSTSLKIKKNDKKKLLLLLLLYKNTNSFSTKLVLNDRMLYKYIASFFSYPKNALFLEEIKGTYHDIFDDKFNLKIENIKHNKFKITTLDGGKRTSWGLKSRKEKVYDHDLNYVLQRVKSTVKKSKINSLYILTDASDIVLTSDFYIKNKRYNDCIFYAKFDVWHTLDIRVDYLDYWFRKTYKYNKFFISDYSGLKILDDTFNCILQIDMQQDTRNDKPDVYSFEIINEHILLVWSTNEVLSDDESEDEYDDEYEDNPEDNPEDESEDEPEVLSDDEFEDEPEDESDDESDDESEDESEDNPEDKLEDELEDEPEDESDDEPEDESDNTSMKRLGGMYYDKNGAIYDDIYDGNYVRHDKKPNNKDLIKTYYY